MFVTNQRIVKTNEIFFLSDYSGLKIVVPSARGGVLK